jgi:hypothetical protein
MTTNDKKITLVIFSLCLTSAAMGRNAPQVQWGRQIITPSTTTPATYFSSGLTENKTQDESLGPCMRRSKGFSGRVHEGS